MTLVKLKSEDKGNFVVKKTYLVKRIFIETDMTIKEREMQKIKIK